MYYAEAIFCEIRMVCINYLEILTEETIQRRKLFKGGNYMRKYGTCKKVKKNATSDISSAQFEALNAQLICQVPQSLFHAFQNAYVQIRHSF